MNFTNDPRGASRFTGIGAVALVHVAIVAGLASGLAREWVAPKPGPVILKPIDQPEPPQPIERPVTPDIQQPKLSVPIIPLPDDPIIMDQRLDTIAAQAVDKIVPTDFTTAKAETGLQQVPVKPVVTDQKVSPQMVCTKMGKPELPAVNWSGEALFRVVATVKSGRVSTTEFQALRGGLDAKTRRAFQSAIDTALHDTYECPGDHRFEQEFAFKVD